MDNIIYSKNKRSFLQELREIIIDLYRHNLSDLTVILPSGLACSTMQRLLIQEMQICVLPRIIPLSAVTAESEEIFHLPWSLVDGISPLDEKIGLASIIAGYKSLKYSLPQALQLAPSLARLFFELESLEIDLAKMNEIVQLEQAEHWENIHDFLLYSLTQWQSRLSSMHQFSAAYRQKMMLNSEIERLKKHKDQHLLIAGTLGDYKLAENFIKKVVHLPNVRLMLPPYSVVMAGANSAAIVKNEIDKSSILHQAIGNMVPESWGGALFYLKFDDSFAEGEYVALKCQQFLEQQDTAKIAIVLNDYNSKEHYCAYLEKYQLPYQDQFGKDLLSNNIVSLLLALATHMVSPFNLRHLFALLSHPLLNCEKSQKLKNWIRQNYKFAEDPELILSSLASADKGLYGCLHEYFALIMKVISVPLQGSDLYHLCEQLMAKIEIIVPNIWQDHSEVCTIIRDAFSSKLKLNIEYHEYLPEIMHHILQGATYFDQSGKASGIILCRANSVPLLNYDLLIMTNVHDATYPKNSNIHSQWISKAMSQALGLSNDQEKIDEQLYNFLLNTQGSHVIITTSKRAIGSGTSVLESPFISHLRKLVGNKLQEINVGIAAEYDAVDDQSNDKVAAVSAKYFPFALYATDIETLIRAPYNFYAKKLLQLRKLEEIQERPSLAEFGNFFHKIVEIYSKSYDPLNLEKELQLREIAYDLLEKSQIPVTTKKIWRTKVGAIAKEFIEFDILRRRTAQKIYCELHGKMSMNLDGRTIDIKAIADRIELRDDGSVTIIDFKTGAVPSLKEVKQGLAPQLLIEAMILIDGGFKIRAGDEVNLLYVKVNSKKPYLTETNIQISRKDILQHQEGLIKLLSYYLDKGSFAIESNLMKYDDYKHLARRVG